MGFLTLSRRRAKRKKNSTQMHYMFQVLHQMGNWFLEEYSIYFKIWLMSEKNETDVWYSKYQWNRQEPEMLRNWWKMTSPQNWVELNPMSLPSTMVDTFMAFESIWRIGHHQEYSKFSIYRHSPHLHMGFRVLAFGADCSFSLDFENSAISSRVYVVNFLSLM